eukprot:EG_transcript_39575
MTRLKFDDDDDEDDGGPEPFLEYLSQPADPAELMPLIGGARTRYLWFEFVDELLEYLNIGLAAMSWLLMLVQIECYVALIRAFFITTIFHILGTVVYGFFICYTRRHNADEVIARNIRRLVMFGCSCAICALLAIPLFLSTTGASSKFLTSHVLLGQIASVT